MTFNSVNMYAWTWQYDAPSGVNYVFQLLARSFFTFDVEFTLALNMSALIPWEWKPIYESTNHRGPAAYAVRLLSGGKVMPIQRFLTVDTEGLLTIGMTTNLENRRRQFIRGTTKGSGHSAGNLIYRLATLTSFKRLAPELSFELAFCVADNKQIALALESETTNKYFEFFGEAPPLTSVIPDRYAHLEQTA